MQWIDLKDKVPNEGDDVMILVNKIKKGMPYMKVQSGTVEFSIYGHWWVKADSRAKVRPRIFPHMGKMKDMPKDTFTFWLPLSTIAK
jgi:hypothetical protein